MFKVRKTQCKTCIYRPDSKLDLQDQAGEIMGIDVLDHIIVGHDDFLSLKERGLL